MLSEIFMAMANTFTRTKWNQLIATFDDITDVWDGLKIDGKDFEEVINHLYIVALN